MTADMMGLDKGFENGIDCVMTMTFGNTGEKWTGAFQKSGYTYEDGLLVFSELELEAGKPLQWRKAE